MQAQIRAVAEDLPPAACKTGMLATAELVRAVAESIRAHGLPNYVLDPVMVATSHDRLLDADAERTILEELLPLAACVTPNLDEAAILVGEPVEDEEAMRRAARTLVERGREVRAAQGRAPARRRAGGRAVGRARVARRGGAPSCDTRSTHGTGCTLSAGIAAGLAHGRPLRQAVEDALDYVQRAMAAAPGLGSGHGPLNHLVPGLVREERNAESPERAEARAGANESPQRLRQSPRRNCRWGFNRDGQRAHGAGRA